MATNTAPLPAQAISSPATNGPTARALLNEMPLRTTARGTSSCGTTSEVVACCAGMLKALPQPSANVKPNSNQGVMLPVNVVTLKAIATTSITICADNIKRRLSRRSAAAPAGKASSIEGTLLAVWISATIKI